MQQLIHFSFELKFSRRRPSYLSCASANERSLEFISYRAGHFKYQKKRVQIYKQFHYYIKELTVIVLHSSYVGSKVGFFIEFDQNFARKMLTVRTFIIILCCMKYVY
ncbi:hypothetical protein ALC53_06658 [Atta colombica]|uniref:Uncharacterized protein n=1 Tax=Atta colombica TaxID=520822 RepID=A0A195BED4_9HYME|nr:hypothetical protein ALC53_06658 [Atta colombica]